MCDFGLAGQVKAAHGILHQAISISDTFVLAQMLHPRSDEECLDHPSFLGSILEHTPGIGTVAATPMFKLGDSF